MNLKINSMNFGGWTSDGNSETARMLEDGIIATLNDMIKQLQSGEFDLSLYGMEVFMKRAVSDLVKTYATRTQQEDVYKEERKEYKKKKALKLKSKIQNLKTNTVF